MSHCWPCSFLVLVEILALVAESTLWLGAHQTQTGMSLSFFHSGSLPQSNDFGPDLISLKGGERDYSYDYDCPEKDALYPCIFIRLSVHNPPRLVNLAAVSLLRDEAFGHLLW